MKIQFKNQWLIFLTGRQPSPFCVHSRPDYWLQLANDILRESSQFSFQLVPNSYALLLLHTKT